MTKAEEFKTEDRESEKIKSEDGKRKEGRKKTEGKPGAAKEKAAPKAEDEPGAAKETAVPKAEDEPGTAKETAVPKAEDEPGAIKEEAAELEERCLEQREEIEQQLSELPIVQYAWLAAKEIPFSEHVRTICRKECPRYGKSWSCPPGVGTVEECKERCSHFSEVFVFTTIAEVADVDNLQETLATRPEHEAVTKKVQEILRPYFGETHALSAQSCDICEKCAYPDGPCRYPNQMMPCVEGYGIVVLPLAEKAGIEFMNGSGIVTWFGMVLLK